MPPHRTGSFLRRILTLAILATLLPACPVLAQDSPADDSEPQSDETPPDFETGYSRGFFLRSSDGDFSIRFNGRIQPRLQYNRRENREDLYSYLIRRARLKISGNAHGPNLKYKFQADFGRGFVILLDAYVDYSFVPDQLVLRIGQSKRPYAREAITSSAQLQFVDRSLTSLFFGGGRDIGIAIQNNYQNSPRLEYALGVYNGTGIRTRILGSVEIDTTTGIPGFDDEGISNETLQFHPQIATRLGYNHGGINGYDQVDFEGGPLRFGVGTSVLLDLNFSGTKNTGIQSEIDFIGKFRHLSTSAAVYYQNLTVAEGLLAGDQHNYGFDWQVGYLIGNLFEPAIRYAAVWEADGGNDDEAFAIAGSFYFVGHYLKWQTDYTNIRIEDQLGGTRSNRFRSQFQFAF